MLNYPICSNWHVSEHRSEVLRQQMWHRKAQLLATVQQMPAAAAL